MARKPKWFTPGRLLLIFCIINLVVYLDRGTAVHSEPKRGCGEATDTRIRVCMICRCSVQQWSEWGSKNRGITSGIRDPGASCREAIVRVSVGCWWRQC